MNRKINAACFLVCFSFTILAIMPQIRGSSSGFLQVQDLLNNSNITAGNGTQISTNGTTGNGTQISKTTQITAANSKAPTDGNSLNTELQIQPFPITKNVDSQFTITFLQPSSQAVQAHVDYDFAITQNNNEVFRASSITGQPLLHTAEGIVKIPYKFTQDGDYLLQVSVMGINFIPIKTEQVLFNLTVS